MINQKKQATKQNIFETIRTITAWDVALIIVFIVAAVYSFPVLYAHQPATVAVYKDNTLYAEYPLSEDREFSLNGYEGPMTIRIQNGHVFVHSSTCRKQICVKSGKISKPFRQIICAPNHVLIEIHSHKKTEEKIDAITQ